jgi:hypothetical protein
MESECGQHEHPEYVRGYADAEARWQGITARLQEEVRQQHQQILRYIETQTAIFRALAQPSRGE